MYVCTVTLIWNGLKFECPSHPGCHTECHFHISATLCRSTTVPTVCSDTVNGRSKMLGSRTSAKFSYTFTWNFQGPLGVRKVSQMFTIDDACNQLSIHPKDRRIHKSTLAQNRYWRHMLQVEKAGVWFLVGQTIYFLTNMFRPVLVSAMGTSNVNITTGP
jgi:hypothetical protein